jgi:anti-sigma B factor antagonist
MQIKEKKIGSNTVITPSIKRIDITVAAQFKDSLVQCHKAGNTAIILDLSKVEFIDSAGLGTIMGSFKTFSQSGDR